jgi:indole-3-glycerol phosphate synthase
VLLTAGLLPRSSLRGLVAAALTAGLTPFVEVTSEAEIEAVPHASDCVIAVNNKDIKVREREPADLGRSLRLLPAVQRSGARCAVSASGIELLDSGYTGLLIGTGLLRSRSLTGWIGELDSYRDTVEAAAA